ncbi:MAG: alpha-amylase family glycosyl hydrolase [Dictyoglomaceae bacterium]|nr:alpha-amylase family glycosyl hydrolase [Dictyoglomaceae bacterium]
MFKKFRILIILIFLILLTLNFSNDIPWHKNLVFYEIFIRSFADSNGDGIGDLRGLVEKLDYLNDGDPRTEKDLGINAIWLMPLFPSSSYHGYDVTDYYNINPDYGSMEDFENLLKETHKRGIKVILDLVLNHTSSLHPWFKSASSSESSPFRNFYLWSSQLPQANSRFWHKAFTGYYYGIFSSEMPDLNYDNAKVREEVKKIAKFWLDKGVDGFRLDAVKYVYEEHEKNISFWKEFYNYVKSIKKDIFLVGEVWDNEYIIAKYYESLPSNFNFPLAQRIISTVSMERDLGLVNYLLEERKLFSEYNPNFSDAIFLTNHDQTRIMSLLGGNKDKVVLSASIYLTLPGIPFIYYGEEIGMSGAKPDEHIREPFEWSKDLKGNYQTRWLKTIYAKPNDGISVEEQDSNKNSILNHYRKLINLRLKYKALSQGDIEKVETKNPTILAYIRKSNKERILIIHNLTKIENKFSYPLTKNSKILYSRNSKIDKNIILGPFSSIIIKI